MTKYVVKGNHPFIKEGVIISDKHLTTEIYGWHDVINYVDIISWLNNEWIEEIKVKEFTKDNMIEFADQCVDLYRGGLYGVQAAFTKYVKTNNLKTK